MNTNKINRLKKVKLFLIYNKNSGNIGNNTFLNKGVCL